MTVAERAGCRRDVAQETRASGSASKYGGARAGLLPVLRRGSKIFLSAHCRLRPLARLGGSSSAYAPSAAGGSPLTLSALPDPGAYKVRYLTEGDGKTLARTSVEIVGAD